eukprot:TRINITY_DN1704_c1_g1_i2.p1 TRINITY_DN1704_c1_g1~~TRINITY_DN1704_c1_g1_i2.p1  ORF type:complete len:239 (+),score=41.18 TRINITY_DN1704_c1_g1_i2:83-718(+)
MSAVLLSQPEPGYDHLFKVLIIGDSGVGKTNLLLRFADDVYQHDSEATIGVDFRICSRSMNNKRVKLQIWDTAGQERFHTITSSYYRGSNGIMVVYDVTDRASFEHVRSWMVEIGKYAKPGTQCLLVGSKCDLANKRVVTFEDGEELARDLGLEFIETSALNAHNTDSAFDLMCAELLKASKPEVVQPAQPEAQVLTLGEIIQQGSQRVCC